MKVLIVDLGRHTHPNLTGALRAHTFAVETTQSVTQAVWLCRETGPGVAVVCVDDAGGRDREVATRLRDAGAWTPVLVVAHHASAAGVVSALEAGADDVVARPVRLTEISARVRALGRRRGDPVPPPLVSGPVRCDLASGEVTRDGVPVELSPGQLAVLAELLRHPGRVVTRAELLEVAWDPAAQEADSNVVDQMIARVRRKLGTPYGAEHLQTVRGRGYRWVA
ncbi:response regulator transcription factor [Luteipulveratus sp. YIM 133132]|uniref:Response regulator transcription factor n=1 Tax=Luteipulveratus flavus TaxID=3031728 RepID=A0ABT6C985_9MICO|nr:MULTISPECIES: response regulator transcription factor [unclassified Luteipulveratus]MDE9366366.1 response regulator transcription factor [Luteipulveratus sp. YIM 133132]MDF8265455.1 response regulator transcription factor [Luteipulveratus sp. YIM 133296]